MYFNWKSWIKWPMLLMALTFFTHCGLLGKKDKKISQVLSPSTANSGCLNDFGQNFVNYMEGRLARADWEKSWDCTLDSLDLFLKFVRGSDPNGYTTTDMQAFISRFLVTNKSIDQNFLNRNFELKSSLLGGSSNVLTYGEIADLKNLLLKLKEVTTALLPALNIRNNPNPTKEEILFLADEMERSLSNLGGYFHQKGSSDFNIEATEELIEELTQLFAWNIPLDLIPKAFEIKSFLLHQSQTRTIEAKEWAALFSWAGRALGITASFALIQKKQWTDPEEKLWTERQLLLRLHKSVFEIFRTHRGVISYEWIGRLIRLIPEKALPVKYEDLTEAMPKVGKMILWNQNNAGLDYSAYTRIYSYLDRFIDLDTTLKLTFNKGKDDLAGLGQDELLHRTEHLSKNASPVRKTSTKLIATVAKETIPIFLNQDSELTFVSGDRYSAENTEKMALLRWASEHLMESYSSRPTKDFAVLDDLRRLVDDFGLLAFSLKFIDPFIPNLYVKRFREADLFTYVSNGDNLLSTPEITYYLAYLISSHHLSNRIRKTTEPICKSDKKDLLDWFWMNAACYRKEFANRFEEYLVHFPYLQSSFHRMNPFQKEELLTDLEKGYRRYGFSEEPVASLDAKSAAGYLHYIESIFFRFDHDNNQYLDVSEALIAFPVFRKLLSEIGKIDYDKRAMLEAAFTYILKFGKPPSRGFSGTAHFLWWKINRRNWKIATTRATLYGIVPLLLGSNEKPPQPQLTQEDTFAGVEE